jgi:hypothetical protein
MNYFYAETFFLLFLANFFSGGIFVWLLKAKAPLSSTEKQRSLRYYLIFEANVRTFKTDARLLFANAKFRREGLSFRAVEFQLPSSD